MALLSSVFKVAQMGPWASVLGGATYMNAGFIRGLIPVSCGLCLMPLLFGLNEDFQIRSPSGGAHFDTCRFGWVQVQACNLEKPPVAYKAAWI